MSVRDPVRLSRFVVFVEYDDHVEVQHTQRGTTARISKHEYLELQEYGGFRELTPSLAPWLERGVLVAPFSDVAGSTLQDATEHGLGMMYQRWYWSHEVETERDYRWLGRVVVKMPSDLFFYQELLAGRGDRPSILELGHGRGGGAWFFASIAHLMGGGKVVSVELDPAAQALDVRRWPGVEAHLIRGDVGDEAVAEQATGLGPQYGLVVVDLGGPVERNLGTLARWGQMVASGGAFVLEDLWGGGGEEEAEVVRRVDEFLLGRRDFGIEPSASRHPLLKGLALRRGELR